MKGYTITDIGKVRAENQDCVKYIESVSPPYGILTLCDGMGGARAGSLASEIAASAFVGRVSQELADKSSKRRLSDVMKEAAALANVMVFQRGESDDSCQGMGTTLVAAVVKSRSCCILNIGDSRAYLITRGTIAQITRDHSLVEEMVARGRISREQAKTHPKKNVITRAVGVDISVESDVFSLHLRQGDMLILCSDGLSNTLSDEEILAAAQEYNDPEAVGRQLVALALTRGAPDNVTVGLLKK